MFRCLKFAVLAAMAVAVFGLMVMGLWNWLTPALFGWKEIGFWQAAGLLVLSRILFGRFPGPWGRGMRWRQHMLERWERMTPEEREKFRAGFQGHCGRAAPADSSGGKVSSV
jgi:H+/Cl- antiporter ClcA